MGNISAAARDCGLSQSQASRIIVELEASVGVRLLSRTTRAVVPTDAGTEFLVRAEAILDAVEDAHNCVREGTDLRGVVRISMSGSFAYREVIPRLPGFIDQHPALRLQIILDDQRQDLVRDAVDIAIRMGKLQDSTATAQRLTSIRRAIVAARRYIEQAGLPSAPEDLANHRIIGGPAGSAAWQFYRDGLPVAIDVQPHASFNDNEGAVIAAIAGLGICSTPMRTCRQELRNGTLIELLAEWERPVVEVHAYFPAGRATRVAARSLANYLKTEFERSAMDCLEAPMSV